MAEYTIKRTDCGENNHVMGVVSDQTSLVDIQRAEPKFFKTPHGKRETYSIYRGQLIVRNTVTFTGQKPTRRTVAYLFFIKGESAPFTLCVSAGSDINSVSQAQHLIDRILDGGTYAYGM